MEQRVTRRQHQQVFSKSVVKPGNLGSATASMLMGLSSNDEFQIVKDEKISDDDWKSIMDCLNITDEENEQASKLIKPVYGDENGFVIDSLALPIALDLTQSILLLTFPKFNNPQFQRNLLITIPVYTTPRLYLICLLTHYFHTDDIEIHYRCFVLLSFWMKICPMHFSDEMLKCLQTFKQILASRQTESQQYLIFAKSVDTTQKIRDSMAPSKPLRVRQPTGPNKFLDFLATLGYERLSELMTLQHSRLFCDISQEELVMIIFKNERPNSLMKFTNNFDVFSTFVSFTVVYKQTPEERSDIFIMWVRIALEFKRMNNYYGLFFAVGALMHTSIKRMTKTMKLVNEKLVSCNYKKQFEKLQELVTFKNNFGVYRGVISKSPPPSVPFIACFQKDAIYFQETNKLMENGLINVKAIANGVKLLDNILFLRNDSYQIEPDDDALEMLDDITVSLDTIGLMKLSNTLEPSEK